MDTDKNMKDEPVYLISIAARLAECHPQTLRTYEQLGLISPSRTSGNLRLYSARDVERVRHIQHLTQERGVNLAGVEIIFDLMNQMQRMREEMEKQFVETTDAMREELRRLRKVVRDD